MGTGQALPVLGGEEGIAPRIGSVLVKPVSAECNLDCAYCFYLNREADPYHGLPDRRMSLETLERLVDTFLFYSYPHSTFAFQGGEPMLAGLKFFERLIEFETRYGRDGQSVSNALQTNAILIDDDWCGLFREYRWLLGVSIDGPREMHDACRQNKAGQGTWRQVIRAIETLQKNKVEFNVLCVLSQANVEKPREVYRFFRGLGIDHIQYIPLAEFDAAGNPLPFTIAPEQYGRFLTETFDLWWPERRKARIRIFDNLAEALAGQKPGDCTLHATCDSYCVVEYGGDVYPCDFFVEKGWKLGNVAGDSWPEIARRQRRYLFAAKKTLATAQCQACEYQPVCHGGCPKLRHGPRRRFEDLDYFCPAYKAIYAKSLGLLRKEVARLLSEAPAPASPC